MTIDERIKLEEKAIKDMQFKEEALDGLPGYMVTKEDYEECKKSVNEHQELINWLEELKAHREAWNKLKDDVVAYRNNFDYCTAMNFLDIIDTRLSEIRRDGGDENGNG